MMAMTGLIIDGGNAFAQQRGTQNAADAASEAGAVVLSQNILALNSSGAAKTDAEVLAGMNASASANSVRSFNPGVAGNSVAYYTDLTGNLLQAGGSTTTDPLLAVRVGSGSIPPCTGGTNTCVDYGSPGGPGVASGVQAASVRDFKTLVSGVIGIGQFTATSIATAVAGYAANPCDAAQGCALLPVTFAANQTTCDGSGNAGYTTTPWIPTQPTGPAYTPGNEVLMSLCKKGEGAFGWLDFGCGNTASQIITPCNNQIYFPTWLQGQPGNPNNVENELNTYAGNLVGTYEPPGPARFDQEVLIPIFDGLCNEDRPGIEPPNPPNEDPVFGTPPFPGTCANNPSGGGANRHYHVLYFIGFILDQAYVQGNNFPACNVAPGGPPSGPFPGGNGSGGCLKGWFARILASPGPVSGIGGAGTSSPLTIQLIK